MKINAFALSFIMSLPWVLTIPIPTTHPATNQANNITRQATVNFLSKYGYLQQPVFIDLFTDQEIVAAIKDYQSFFGLPITGIVDQATANLMKKKRCGVPDKISDKKPFQLKLTPSGRKKRDAVIFSNKQNIQPLNMAYFYFKIGSLPNNFSINETYEIFEYGFNVWASVTNLVFIRGDGVNVPKTDITVDFYKGDHGDGKPFDGNGSVVAHASTTRPYVAHFDLDETWVLNRVSERYFITPNISKNSVDLIFTIIHEIGHIFGFVHVNKKTDSVMQAMIINLTPNKNYFLYNYDINAIQQTYGMCIPDRIDAIFSAANRDYNTYIIVGPYTYLYDGKLGRVAPGWPRSTKSEFGKDYIIEALQNTDGYLYFFTNNGYYLNVQKAYTFLGGSQKIWIGLNMTQKLDAAMVFVDGKTYLFQQDKVYRWNMSGKSVNPYPNGMVELGWPKKISKVFPGVPNNLDTAFKWYYDNKVYFFKGSQYYVWNHDKADGPYSNKDWKNVCNVFMCPPKHDIQNCLSW